MRYEDEPVPVTRVLIRVEKADGGAEEYEAVEPQDFTLVQGMAAPRRTGLAVAAGEGFAPVSQSVPTLSVRLTAHPRHNLHIRTHGPWKVLSDGAHSALASFIAAMGYR